MSASRFIDTNILVYAYDTAAGPKRGIASQLVRAGWAVPGSHATSVQVLQELFVTMVRKELSTADAKRIVDDVALWPVVDNSLQLFRNGLSEQARWGISLWDAMIIAAARASGATDLITEDLNHGQDYGGIRAINPFIKT